MKRNVLNGFIFAALACMMPLAVTALYPTTAAAQNRLGGDTLG